MQLWMYASPVVYAASTLSPKAYSIVMLNRISPIIELSRYGWLGAGAYSLGYWAISWVTTIVVLFLGLILFNKVEKTFMDTV